jgi:glycosyltransferase involved in cell wall biosynthesis
MNLAIVNLTSGGLSGGYRKYLQKLLPLLKTDHHIHELHVFIPPQTGNLPKIESFSFLTWPATDHKNSFPWVKKKIRQLSPDVVFIPTARWIDCGQIPIVTMVRNMEPLTASFGGNPLEEGIKNLFRTYVAKRSCLRATRVIAVSEYVKDFLQTHWNIESNKIGIVYHGVEPPTEPGVLPNSAQPPKIECEPFIFTAGSIRPARGLEDIINALAMLRNNSSGYRLVIAGAVDPGMEFYKRKLDKLSTRLGIASQIIWAGFLSEQDISWCYHHCAVFVMTSRAEACPNTVLEAMAHGCVCISTETPPMPEFFKDVAIYYPPKDAKALADAIRSALEWDDGKRKESSSRTKWRATEFSWDVCAEKTVAELAKTIQDFKQNRRNDKRK